MTYGATATRRDAVGPQVPYRVLGAGQSSGGERRPHGAPTGVPPLPRDFSDHCDRLRVRGARRGQDDPGRGLVGRASARPRTAAAPGRQSAAGTGRARRPAGSAGRQRGGVPQHRGDVRLRMEGAGQQQRQGDHVRVPRPRPAAPAPRHGRGVEVQEARLHPQPGPQRPHPPGERVTVAACRGSRLPWAMTSRTRAAGGSVVRGLSS